MHLGVLKCLSRVYTQTVNCIVQSTTYWERYCTISSTSHKKWLSTDFSPFLQVWYYEKADESLSNGRSHTPSSHGSPSSSRSLSPPPSQPPTSQMSNSDRSTLDQEITAVLKGRLNGVYGKRLGKEYEKFFNRPPPPDIMDYAKALPFVQWEE